MVLQHSSVGKSLLWIPNDENFTAAIMMTFIFSCNLFDYILYFASQLHLYPCVLFCICVHVFILHPHNIMSEGNYYL